RDDGSRLVMSVEDQPVTTRRVRGRRPLESGAPANSVHLERRDYLVQIGHAHIEPADRAPRAGGHCPAYRLAGRVIALVWHDLYRGINGEHSTPSKSKHK